MFNGYNFDIEYDKIIETQEDAKAVKIDRSVVKQAKSLKGDTSSTTTPMTSV